MKDIKIVMAYDSNLAVVGDLAAVRAKNYASKWGYKFECVHGTPADHPGRRPMWMKVSVLRRSMQDCDWLLWMDADAFIVDMDTPLDSLIVNDANVFISQDVGGLCTGVMAYRNCEWSAKFLETLDFLGQTKSTTHFEQAAVKALCDNWKTVSDQIVLIPEEAIQNPKSKMTTKPLIYHYWSQWNPLSLIADRMRTVVDQGWSDACRLIN